MSARKVSNRLKIAHCGEHHLEFAALVGPQRLEWTHPLISDGLARVVRGDLTTRRERHEESGVVSSRRPHRRDPVRDVLETSKIEEESLVPHHREGVHV